jgi:hypothetical protein
VESIRVQQVLRPARYAFLIRSGDHDAADRAVSLNTVIWGGIFNPIVEITPEERCLGILKEFDPDKLIDLTDGSLSAKLSVLFADRIIDGNHVTVADRHGDGVPQLGFGFNVIPLLGEIYNKETRFIRDKIIASLYSCPSLGDWDSFFGFQFGSFTNLPKLGIDFKKHFIRALNALECGYDPKTLDQISEAPITPIKLTAYGLSLYGGQASFSSHIIYIGDHRDLADLIEFWNIRATGRACVFVPTAHFRIFADLIRDVAISGKYSINEQVENRADLQKGVHVEETIFNEICDWISSLNLDSLPRRTWGPRFGMSADWYVGDIHVSDIEANRGEEISLLEGSTLTPIKLIQPQFLAETKARKGDFEWAMEIKMWGGLLNEDFVFSIPDEPKIDRRIAARITHKLASETRIGRRGLVLIEDFPTSSLLLSPLRTKELFDELFQSAGLVTGISVPGQYMEQIIRKMGYLQFDCRIFKIRGVREIIKKLSNGSILTQGNMYGIVMSSNPDEFGQNWRPELYEDMIVRRDQTGKLNFGTIFQELLEKRVVRPGFELACENCFATDWYHVSEFSEEYVCRFCFTKQRVNFAAKKEWQYKADGLFRIENSAQGSIAAIAALWRIHAVRSLGEGRYQCSVKLRDREGHEYELDYAYFYVAGFSAEYDLILGQAKNFTEFNAEEINKMGRLSEKFDRRPYLCFSTMKESFSDQEKVEINRLVAAGYKVIALTRHELDPYFLHSRFKNAPIKYAVSFTDLSLNTIHLNLR